uniref:Uncharacterized protein n=1 Tax=Chrysotila carterae TaxID=13221 RepID=A0A6S9T0L4_CHRCT
MFYFFDFAFPLTLFFPFFSFFGAPSWEARSLRKVSGITGDSNSTTISSSCLRIERGLHLRSEKERSLRTDPPRRHSVVEACDIGGRRGANCLLDTNFLEKLLIFQNLPVEAEPLLGCRQL